MPAGTKLLYDFRALIISLIFTLCFSNKEGLTVILITSSLLPLISTSVTFFIVSNCFLYSSAVLCKILYGTSPYIPIFIFENNEESYSRTSTISISSGNLSLLSSTLFLTNLPKFSSVVFKLNCTMN